ncbi:hypothetical protein GCM10023175_09630 [Pseudonocardia xishanensis]|uniref:Uncharacterized protein n=1 Tax=Pseudonocardia xishanensis TaxID=630995 RepID=A0ABP8RHQ2_9PSEU
MPGDALLLGRHHGLDRPGEARGVGAVLVLREERGAPGEQVRDRLQRGLLDGERVRPVRGQRGRVVRRQPAPPQGLEVALHGHPVDLHRPLQGVAPRARR